MTPDPVLSVSGLTVRRGRSDVLRGIDLAVSEGEVVAVLGPNGAGKSTLVNTLGGLLKPRAGTLERNGRLATVMQSPGLARRSARANVELAMAWWGVPRSGRRARAEKALELMHAGHLARRPAHALSGGEQRRIHLARAIAVAPDLLLLDEPFDGLDPTTHATLREDTAAALRTSGGAVIVVLHDRIDAWAIADRIVVLLDGEVRAQGTPQQVLDAPPTPDVARFLGYDGELSSEHGVLLTRATHVRVARDGELPGTVLRRVGIEDGSRLELQTPRGRVWALHFPDDAGIVTPQVGEQVQLRLQGGVEFPASAEPGRGVSPARGEPAAGQ